MKKSITSIILSLSLLFLVTACTKVIDLDLKDKSGQYVIEGVITDQLPPYFVKISKSAAYNNDNGFEDINNALVIISDNTGIIDTLTLVSNGTYQTNKISGSVGVTYNLNVVIGSQLFNAESTMPSHINFDSLEVVVDGSRKYLQCLYKDNALETNYYRFKTTINGKQTNMFNVVDDKLNNGLIASQSLYEDIKSGDAVNVSMMCIDKNIYNYFYSLSQITGVQESATPANPISNINGGCLGYFSAQTLQDKFVIIP